MTLRCDVCKKKVVGIISDHQTDKSYCDSCYKKIIMKKGCKCECHTMGCEYCGYCKKNHLKNEKTI
jgi:hypothetical protein